MSEEPTPGLDWHRPENMHRRYVPPLVSEGIVPAATFWEQAVQNTRLRIADIRVALATERTRLAHAEAMHAATGPGAAVPRRAGRPRVYNPDRPATVAERTAAFRRRLKERT